jgi:hypothetical protein
MIYDRVLTNLILSHILQQLLQSLILFFDVNIFAFGLSPMIILKSI